MKMLLLLLSLGFFTQASAQSYLIMNNGSTLTTDKSGFIYDFGHYAYPHKISMKGGVFFVEENSIIATIDENGMLYRKYEHIPEKIKGKGINYFLSSEGELYTIDRTGGIKIKVQEEFKRASHFGGRYFLIAQEDGFVEFVTINLDGEFTRHPEMKMKLTDIVSLGGSYFMNRRGVVHTINSWGEIEAKTGERVGIIERRGGNFFSDSSNFIYTISENGELITPAVPMNLSISNIVKNATNYFVDLQGRLFIVNDKGEIYHKELEGYDFKNIAVISL